MLILLKLGNMLVSRAAIIKIAYRAVVYAIHLQLSPQMAIVHFPHQDHCVLHPLNVHLASVLPLQEVQELVLGLALGRRAKQVLSVARVCIARR